MPDIKLSREYRFEAAHILENHNGKCARLHGHGYLVQVWMKGEPKKSPSASNDGMLLDFQDMDDIIKPDIEKMDHKFLAGGSEAIIHKLTAGDRTALGIVPYFTGMRTTCENLARYMWSLWAPAIRKNHTNVNLMSVVLYETQKSFAEFIQPINP